MEVRYFFHHCGRCSGTHADMVRVGRLRWKADRIVESRSRRKGKPQSLYDHCRKGERREGGGAGEEGRNAGRDESGPKGSERDSGGSVWDEERFRVRMREKERECVCVTYPVDGPCKEKARVRHQQEKPRWDERPLELHRRPSERTAREREEEREREKERRRALLSRPLCLALFPAQSLRLSLSSSRLPPP